MNPTGNTILITGGGSGIGRGLAEAFHKQGNQVIIAGRRQSVLDAATAANPGMKSYILDIEDPTDIESFATRVSDDFPSLNALINNAGVMRTEDFTSDPIDLSAAESTITTNLLGPIRLTAALLPTLKQQQRATIATVSSGLAFLPLTITPTYCATKAAIHSWTQSLRYQLRDTHIEVLEIAPPYVQTELMGAQQAADPRAMPLADYIAETISLLENPPASGEILVERVLPLRWAEKNGSFDQIFQNLNSSFHEELTGSRS
ncbi:MAG TPA: SDR family oxidoreductase [Acidobacteriaceae bacterium]|nr:SDR family oxidoreductase [Acidobacteriaceae bacterium]